MSVTDLPTALLHKCFSRLSGLTLLRAGVQCREWRHAADDEDLWRELCKSEFPETTLLSGVRSYKHLWARWSKAEADTKFVKPSVPEIEFIVSMHSTNGETFMQRHFKSSDMNDDGTWTSTLVVSDDALRAAAYDHVYDDDYDYYSRNVGVCFADLLRGLDASVKAFRPGDENVLSLMRRQRDGRFDLVRPYHYYWEDSELDEYCDHNRTFFGGELAVGATQTVEPVLLLSSVSNDYEYVQLPADLWDEDGDKVDDFQARLDALDVSPLRVLCQYRLCLGFLDVDKVNTINEDITKRLEHGNGYNPYNHEYYHDMVKESSTSLAQTLHHCAMWY